MTGELDVLQFRASGGIDDGEASLAITDDDMPVARIDPDIVGVVSQVQPAAGSEIATAKKLDGPVAGIGDNDHVRAGNIGDALRCLEPTEPVEESAGPEVDHINAIVAELGHE